MSGEVDMFIGALGGTLLMFVLFMLGWGFICFVTWSHIPIHQALFRGMLGTGFILGGIIGLTGD